MDRSIAHFSDYSSASADAPGGALAATASGRALAPLVGVVRNPRSHRNKGHMPELADHPNILITMPACHAALRDALAEFARRGVDYIAVDGGDGTVRDLLSCGADVFGERWPALIILPKGKTNALATDLGLPDKWPLREALAAGNRGRFAERRPIVIEPEGTDGERVLGFFLGAGVISVAIEAGQEAHRLGAFNSFAVGVTTAWGVIQCLFGRRGNPWRRSTPMRLEVEPGGVALPRSPHGAPGERFMLIASTFERFPLGARPFGRSVRPGLKLGVIDAPVRWLVALVPAIIVGLQSRFLARHGAFAVDVEAVGMELGGSFILDGESFPPGPYRMSQGPRLRFVVP